MKHNYFIRNLTLSMAFLVLGLSACKKDSLETKSDPETVGVYVLHEGNWNMGDSGIDFYDIKNDSLIADYFKKTNGYDLGESAVQLKQYGNKIYCVVSGTDGVSESFVEVLDPSNLKSIKRIPFFKGTDAYLPRSIAFSAGKAYVAGFDGYIRRIDTGTLAVDKEIKAGGALEGMAIANQKLYVSNSDRFWTGNGSTISIVDLKSFSLLKEIEVGSNPKYIDIASDGNLFVTVAGIQGGPFSFKKIDTKTDMVTVSHKTEVDVFTISETAGYAAVGAWGDRKVKLFNTTTGVMGGDFITDTTSIATPYGITVNSLNKDVLIADSRSYGNPGMAYCFKSDGTLRYKFKTGQSPQQAVFIYK